MTTRVSWQPAKDMGEVWLNWKLKLFISLAVVLSKTPCLEQVPKFTLLAHNVVYKVQRDSDAIPSSNYSQSIRDGWFVVSFSHVPEKNAKPFKPLSGGGGNEAKGQDKIGV